MTSCGMVSLKSPETWGWVRGRVEVGVGVGVRDRVKS